MHVIDTPVEQVRNRVLRRADWRFLLPAPNPVRGICFAGGPLADSVAAISGGMADSSASAPEAACDLAVAVDPDDATLRRAHAALRAGGSLYSEWYSLRAGGPQAVRRRLEDAGWSEVECYAPRPDPARAAARVWLPLEADGAVHYFLGQPAGRGEPVRRWLRAARNVLWQVSPGLRWTRPICAIGRKPATPACAAASRPSRDGLFDVLLEQWEEWNIGPRPARLSTLLLTSGGRSVNKVVALIFAEPERQPRLVVKIPRVPEAAAGLRNEAAALAAVLASGNAVPGVPRVLFCRSHGGALMVGETAVSGQPIARVVGRENGRALAVQATDWASALAGRAEPSPATSWKNRLVDPVLAEFVGSFGSAVDAALVREAADILATLAPLPLVCEQRDFSPWNVLVTRDGALSVLDWESAELRGLPAVDLIYFLTYLAFYLDGAMASNRFRESYRRTLEPGTMTGDLVRECLDRYGAATGVDPRAMRPLRLLAWMLHSRSEYRRLVEDVGGKPGRDVLRRSLFVGLWEEELRHGERH